MVRELPLVYAADPSKVLRIAMIYAETGFDPATANDVNSTAVIAGIMEPLLTFDYLARPARLVPLTAAALPEIDDSGKTYTFRINRGSPLRAIRRSAASAAN